MRSDELCDEIWRAIWRRNEQTEAAIREALGRWASELEPALCFGPGSKFLGLTAAGHGKIYVRSDAFQ